MEEQQSTPVEEVSASQAPPAREEVAGTAVENGFGAAPKPATRRSATSVLGFLPLAFAGVWFVVSLVFGVGLMSPVEVTGPAFLPKGAPLEPTSRPMAYGGDAYTGIQNAASATEHAVVEVGNHVVAANTALAGELSKAQRDVVLESTAAIQRGLGFLVIASGVVPLILVLPPLVNSRKRASTAPTLFRSSGLEDGEAEVLPTYSTAEPELS